jgi:hypothetical protein
MTFNVNLRSLTLLFLVPLTIPWHTNAQTVSTETGMIKAYLYQLFGTDESLVTGTLYIGPARGSIEGSPFFIDSRWKTGSVRVENRVFDDVSLRYDVEINQFILSCATATLNNVQIGLRSTAIERITMEDRVFIPMPLSTDSTIITYAELLSEGKINYLVTRKKYLVLTNGSGMTDYIYREIIKQYLWYNNELVNFRRKSDLLDLLPGLKSEINQHTRQNRLKYKRKNLTDRALIIDYCNSILNQQQ